jgi:Flp pilus assembly protein TadD
MKRYFLTMSIFLYGCGMNPSIHSYDEAKKEIMVKANNYAGLVDFYRKQLKRDDSSELKLKLGSAYYNMKNFEAASFHLSKIDDKSIKEKKELIQLFDMRSNIFYEQERYELCMQYINKSLKLNNNDPKLYNLLGLAYSKRGEYMRAKTAFSKARTFGYDDKTVLTNIAMVNMLEGNYNDAIDTLYHIWRGSGRLSVSLKQNLLMALAKMGRKFEFKKVMAFNNATEKEINEKYVLFRKEFGNEIRIGDVIPVNNILDKTATGLEVNNVIKKMDTLSSNLSGGKSKVLDGGFIMSMTKEAGRNEYIITFNQDIKNIMYKKFFVKTKDKWVFDFGGNSVLKMKRTKFFDSGIVDSVVFGLHPDFLRLVLKLKSGSSNEPTVKLSGNKFIIGWPG